VVLGEYTLLLDGEHGWKLTWSASSFFMCRGSPSSLLPDIMLTCNQIESTINKGCQLRLKEQSREMKNYCPSINNKATQCPLSLIQDKDY